MPVPQLKFFRALWGAEAQFSTDIDVLFAEIHRLGYAGIEATLSDVHRICSTDPDAFERALQTHRLEFVGLAQTNYPTYQNGPWQDLPIDEHVTNLDTHLKEFVRYKPVHVNIQGGQDSWSVEENEEFIEKALEVQAKYPQMTSSHEVSISHTVVLYPLTRSTSDASNSRALQSVHHRSFGQTLSGAASHSRLFPFRARL